MIRKTPHVYFAALVSLAVCGVEPTQAQTTSNTRNLVPGVITTIRDASVDDSTIDPPREFSELLSVARPEAWKPHFDPASQTLLEMAKRVSFQRETHTLEIGFKSLRVIQVDGRDVWYLVYFVRNTGEARTPVRTDTGIDIKTVSKPIRFVPTFVLQSHGLEKAYRDQVRPEYVSEIAAKERVAMQLYDSNTIAGVQIPVSTENRDRPIWGVATWDNVDPRTDFVSVFVQGLSNAYHWEPPADGYVAGETTHEQDRVLSKTLQINFWRAGDEIDLHDTEIHYGIPLYPQEPVRQQEVLDTYQLSKPVSYQWVYR